MDRKKLSNLFQEYLYRVKEWIKGNYSDELSENNMEMFKGVTAQDNSKKYFIGMLVSYKRDGNYEVIDGQQRLTTINILMNVFGEKVKNALAYRARKKSNDTIRVMHDEKKTFAQMEDKDNGIVSGHKFAWDSYESIVPVEDRANFILSSYSTY